MEISKKWLYVYMAVFTLALCFAWTVNADTILSQTTADGLSNTGGSNHALSLTQNLGTSLNGAIGSIKISYVVNESATSSISFIARLWECTSGNFIDCTSIKQYWDFTATPGAGSYNPTLASSSAYLLNSAKYYTLQLGIASGGTTDIVQYKGSIANLFTTSNCVVDVGSCGTITDLYFILSGAQGASVSEGITSIISPTNQSTTANNTPLFSYTYYTTHSYVRAGVILKDLTTGQSIDTSGASSTISSSGSHTYSEYIGVTTGHLYSWQPYIYTTDNSLPAIYGTTQTFFAVTTSAYQSLYTQQATSANPFATSTIYTCWTTNNCFAQSATSSFQYSTSSVTARCAIRSLPDVVATQMAIKMPFSYICDIALLMTELAYGNGTYAGNIVAALPNSFHGSTTNVTMLDQTAIAGLGELGSIKQLMKYSVYFMTALAIISMALGAL